MAEGITENGLQQNDYNTLLANLQNSLNAIYAPDGDNINFGPETPDGDSSNIYTQMGADIRELNQELYNSFDPSKCSGTVQDSRYSLNYIFRNGGTFTIQNIDVTVDKTLTLQGLDENYNDLNSASYTVSDNAGNLWYLIDTTILEAGKHSLPFRSKNIGLVQPAIGIITNQVTKVLGVVSVINSVAATTLGSEQESDAQFRVRRERSTERRGQNNIDAMLSQILDLDGVSDATTWVNDTTETDSIGTAGGFVWVIVEGGANTDIASIVYTNSCGAGTRGEISVDVPAVSGQIFNVKFDRPTPIPLFLKFDFKLTVELSAVNLDSIKTDIAESLIYNLNENAETSKPTCEASNAIVSNGGGGYALNMEISKDGNTWTDFIPSASRANKFVVDPTRIIINILSEA